MNIGEESCCSAFLLEKVSGPVRLVASLCSVCFMKIKMWIFFGLLVHVHLVSRPRTWSEFVRIWQFIDRHGVSTITKDHSSTWGEGLLRSGSETVHAYRMGSVRRRPHGRRTLARLERLHRDNPVTCRICAARYEGPHLADAALLFWREIVIPSGEWNQNIRQIKQAGFLKIKRRTRGPGTLFRVQSRAGARSYLRAWARARMALLYRSCQKS